MLYFCLNFIILSLLSIQNIKGYPQGVENNYGSANKKGRYLPELYGAAQGKYVPDYSGKYQHMPVPYDGGYGDRGLKYVQVIRGPSEGFQDNNLNGDALNIQDIINRSAKELNLGPDDHLRFSIDFNFNGTGWQVIKFEWVRDDELNKNYNFLNEYKLWENVLDNQQNQQQNVEINVDDFTDNRNADWINETKIEQSPIETHSFEDAVVKNNADVGLYDKFTTTTEQVPVEERLSTLFPLDEPTDVNPIPIQTEQIYDQTDVGQNIKSVHVDDNHYKQNENEKKDVQAVIYEILEYIQTKVLPTLNK